MDGTAVTPCTSAMAINDGQIVKRTYFLYSSSKLVAIFLLHVLLAIAGLVATLWVSVIWQTPTRTTIANQRRGTNTVQM